MTYATVVGIDLDAERLARVLRDALRVAVDADHRGRTGVDRAEVLLLRDQHRRLGVGEHELLALGAETSGRSARTPRPS